MSSTSVLKMNDKENNNYYQHPNQKHLQKKPGSKLPDDKEPPTNKKEHHCLSMQQKDNFEDELLRTAHFVYLTIASKVFVRTCSKSSLYILSRSPEVSSNRQKQNHSTFVMGC